MWLTIEKLQMLSRYNYIIYIKLNLVVLYNIFYYLTNCIIYIKKKKLLEWKYYNERYVVISEKNVGEG